MAALFDFAPTNTSLNLPAEIPILSLFNFQPKSPSKQRVIQPGMDTETIADILSDLLIEMVKKDMMQQEKTSEQAAQATPASAHR